MPRFLSSSQHDGSTRAPIHGVLMAATAKRLVISALPGVRPEGTLPEGIEAQAAQVFDNLVFLLAKASLRGEDIVAIRATVACPGAAPLIHGIAAAKLPGARPAAGVREVVGLSQPGILIELDVEAVGG